MNPLSIGNFFHEDLAYLAALEARGNLAQDIEEKRAAWWNLLLWYLNDDLKVIEQPLQGQPFLDWVPKLGGRMDGTPAFERISWLEREGKVIGIISPVLLVRPLPDENLAGSPWNAAAPVTERVRGRLLELVRNLDEARPSAGQRNFVPFCCRLGPIISARNIGAQANAPYGDTILTSFSFLDPYTLESTDLLIPTGDGAFLIPRCANCATPLLPATVRMSVDSPAFSLSCSKCSNLQQLRLSDFGCAWVDGEFVVWRERALQWAGTATTIRMPPVPSVDPDQAKVTFSYPSVSALANLAMRDLTLDLPQGTPFRVINRLGDLNYPSYLWPGDPDPTSPVSAIPLPLRIENARLVNSARARKVNNRVEVTLGLRGLPADVYWIFLPAAIATSSIAIYPNPSNVPPAWNWFDIATDDGLKILPPPGMTNVRNIGPHRVRTENTAVMLPAVEVSNVSGSGVQASCTLLLSRSESRGVMDPIDFFVGFDFGSSNTALRFSLDGTHGNSRALSEGDLRMAVAGLTVSPDFEEAADRLVPKSAADDASFQSQHCQEHHVARVVGTPCCGKVRPGDVLFKSDPRWDRVRMEYIAEMLIHGLIGAARYLGDRPLNVSGVFSYPLTFTTRRLALFKTEVMAVIDLVSARTGGVASIARGKAKFVDEATAGVNSLGQPQAKEVVLTADLGGGTLDVSIGRAIDGPSKDQIGSLEVGGSYFLRRGDQASELEAYASAATNIARGKVDRREWSRRKPQVNRYYELLFVLLESVLGSFIVRRTQHEPVERVSLYPLGNGWRFYELMVDPMQVEPAKFIRGEIDRLAKNLAAAIRAQHGVAVDVNALLDRNPKEAVASGCLRVATMTGGGATEEVMPRLPVGMDSANGSVAFPWHALFVGQAASKTFVNNALEFDELGLRKRLQTPNGETWTAEPFDGGLLRAELQTEEYYWEGAGYTRGPIQLLIEKQWLPRV